MGVGLHLCHNFSIGLKLCYIGCDFAGETLFEWFFTIFTKHFKSKNPGICKNKLGGGGMVVAGVFTYLHSLSQKMHCFIPPKINKNTNTVLVLSVTSLPLSYNVVTMHLSPSHSTKLTDIAGISKGVGFIRFDQRCEAERAIKQLNGTIPESATEPITVKFANSPSSNKTVLPVAAMAQYLAPTRRFIGPVHHPASRFT